MGTNNNRLWITRLPLGDRKFYQKPAIWMGKLQPFRMICGSGNEGYSGGDANEDHIIWEEEKGNSNIWEEEKE